MHQSAKDRIRILLLSLGALSLFFVLYNTHVRSNPAGFNFYDATVLDEGLSTTTSDGDANDRCQYWAVVAPLDTKWASEAVRRQVKMYNWCLVIVLDDEPSESYNTRWFAGEGENKVVFILTPHNIKRYPSLVRSEFVQANSWDLIGRKNIGYYYALTQGAKIIWDFDDDNMLKFWIKGAAPPGAPSIEASVPITDRIEVFEAQRHINCSTWNPYPAMGAPSLPSWPRGLPLDDATNEQCSSSKLVPSTVTSESIAVLQSLSDRQPDADALYQAIMPFPFYFKKREMKSVLVPPYVLTPYNMQATLHFEIGFWALFLPRTSVDKEHSDIWRSYIGQRLFWEVGLRVGFTGRPLVVQDRNIHISLDKASVKEYSFTLRKLIKFLGSWRGKEDTFIRRIKELWHALEKNSFITHRDLTVMHLWLQCLTELGYKFPSLVTSNSIPEYQQSGPGDLDSILSKVFPKKFETERYTARKNTPEYDDTICQRDSMTGPLTFWNSDIHFGSIVDQPSFLGNLGQNVLITIKHKRPNPNAYVWKMKGIRHYDTVSNVLKTKYKDTTEDQNRPVVESFIKDNFEFYKNDREMAAVDAFLCLYQPGMCELWMPFNKTIIFLPAHRYNMGRCTIERTNRLNEHLHMLSDISHPKHVIAASSKYDLEYLRHYTGLEVLPLYSYCLYVSNSTYSPSREEIPIFARESADKRYNNWNQHLVTDIKKFKLVSRRRLYNPYTFSNLASHRAIVFIPYAVMTYKLTEIYTMGIPLFIPSMKYYHNVHQFGPDRTMFSFIWCTKERGTLTNPQMLPHPTSIHPYSPNAKDKESEFYWLQMADFVQWPHVTYFDDFKDLEEKLSKADFNKIHRLMMEENKRKQKELENNWCKVFNKIEKGRAVPQDYTKAIRELYGVSKLQVE